MTNPLNSLIFLLLFGMACFITGLAKGGLNGLRIVVAPMLALVMPADEALGLILPVLILGDLFALGAYWQAWDNRLLWLLLSGGLLGVGLGTYIITSISPGFLSRALAVLIFLFVVYRLLENKIKKSVVYQNRPWHGLLSGTAAGFLSALAHSGGPPVTMYLLMQNLKPAVFVATSAIFFTALNWVKLPFYISAGLIDFHNYTSLWFMLPLVPLGVWAGKWLINHLDKKVFEMIITLILLGTGIVLWIRA